MRRNRLCYQIFVDYFAIEQRDSNISSDIKKKMRRQKRSCDKLDSITRDQRVKQKRDGRLFPSLSVV